MPILVLVCAVGGGALGGEPAFRRHTLNPESAFAACTAVDVNRDGRLDVVCGGWWYEAPHWHRHTLRDVAVIRGRYDDNSNLPLDVDGDGLTDLISANYRSGKLVWIRHPGKSGGLWTEHVIAMPGPMETGRLVDIDGDGRLDVLPNGVSFAAWWEPRAPAAGVRDRPGDRWLRHDLPSEVAGHGLGFGDIDGDGRGDLVGPRGWLQAPHDPRRGRWIWHLEFLLHPDAGIPILVFDVDGDGASDLVWGRGHSIGLYWMRQIRGPSRTAPVSVHQDWVLHTIDTSVSQLHSLLLADLDNDGKPEVVAGKRYLGHEGRDPGEYDPLGIYWYRFDGSASAWRRGIISEGGPVGFGLDPQSADLDADGDLDLICPDRSGLFWLENLLIAKNRPADRPTPVAAPPSYPDHAHLLVFRDERGNEQPVKSPFDWSRRRMHVLANVQQVMGNVPDPSRRVPLDVRIQEQTRLPQYIRKRLTYVAEPGDRVPAFLLVPNRLAGKAPAMLCLHQTVAMGKGEPVGLGNRPTLHYAHELACRGYVCLAPDYPSFGDYSFEFAKVRDRYPSGSMKAIWNNLRAVDLLESLPEVDRDRIGCIGHSLGGHNTIFTAVFDQRLRALVSSCGFTAFHHYLGGNLAGWTSDRYMPRIRDVYGNDPNQVPFDFYELVAALAPRPFFVNAPIHDSNFDVAGVRKVIARAGAVYELLGAGDRLTVAYPDSAHDFPDAVRFQAYDWLNRWLKPAR